jgi:hypothetical protein
MADASFIIKDDRLREVIATDDIIKIDNNNDIVLLVKEDNLINN